MLVPTEECGPEPSTGFAEREHGQPTGMPSVAVRPEFLPSIALIRALAALIVVYDHLVGMWLDTHRVAWRPAQFADQWIFEPFHIMTRGGSFAVAMFFLVSGFVIVMVSQRETLRVFAIRRALRIYPAFWVSTLLLLAVYALLAPSPEPGVRGYAVQDVLAQANPWPYIVKAMTLGNYLLGTPPVNGVAWTLVIEVLFYFVVALLLPLIRSRPRTALAAAFAGLALLQLSARAGAFVFLLAVNMVYVTYLFLGTLIYLRWSGQIGNGFFGLGTLAFGGLFLAGIRSIVLQPPLEFSDYGVSYAAAWLAFVVFLLLDDRLRLGRLSSFFSKISYSLYLNHGGIGLLSLTLLVPLLGYAASLVLTFALVVAISAASYRWVEAPSRRLARALTSRPRHSAGASGELAQRL